MRIPRALDRLATHGRPLLPAAAWPALRLVASLGQEGPLVALPAFRRVLVLAPHPDDETIGPGGTVALLAAAGAAVRVAVLTDGEATPGTGLAGDEIARRRRAEAGRACARLGVDAPRFLGFRDGHLCDQVAELAGAIAGLVGEVAPEVIFLPWFGDGLADHRAPTDAIRRAGLPDQVMVWGYETWAPLPANRLVEISSVIECKQDAIAEHRTAHAAFDVGAMLSLNRYRSVHGLAGHGWAEAFLAAPADRYLALAGLR